MAGFYTSGKRCGKSSAIRPPRRRVVEPRDRRPNPRVPLDPRIEAAVAELRSVVVAGLNDVEIEMFPITRLAEPIVRRRFPRLDPGIASSVLAEVVEAALACPVVRLCLLQERMHVA